MTRDLRLVGRSRKQLGDPLTKANKGRLDKQTLMALRSRAQGFSKMLRNPQSRLLARV